MRLQTHLVKPSWRLVRRLAERTAQLDAIRDLIQHQIAEEQLNQQMTATEIARKLEWLEVFIIAFYGFEFLERIVEVFPSGAHFHYIFVLLYGMAMCVCQLDLGSPAILVLNAEAC